MGGVHSIVKADHEDFTKRFRTKDSFIKAVDLRQDMNLSDYIWNGAVDLLPKAWNTTFIAGVSNGDMDPNFYGNYILQDAVYCRIVAQLWTQLANNASVDEKVREYASNSISGFQECSTTLFDEWNVKDDEEDGYGVIVRAPVMQYVTFIEDTMLEYPPNVLFATYACLKLWNNLTGDLWSMVENSTTNPYKVWVSDNHGSGSSARRQAAQMNEWDQQYQWYNWSEALSLFRTAVMNEINFFENAGLVTSTSLGLHTIHKPRPLLSKKQTHVSI